MSQVTSRISEYKAEKEILRGHLVTIVTYRLGTNHFCLVEGDEAGATICRATASSEASAREAGIEAASKKLVPRFEAKKQDLGSSPVVKRIEIQLGCEHIPMSCEEFVSLPYATQYGLIFSGGLQFFSDSGSTIPPGEAIESLRHACR